MAQSKGKRKKTAMPAYELAAPELVVVVNPEAGLRAGAEGLVAEDADARPLAKAIDAANAELQPLFGVSEDRLRAEAATAAATTGDPQPNLFVYYRAEGAEDPSALAEEVSALDFVECAYLKPPAEPPTLPQEAVPLTEEPPLVTPDFTARQAYLEAAPGGIDARHAWTHPGGDGAGVNIIDIEGAWRFTHEDLLVNQGGVIGGTMSEDKGWRDHGTAVIGEFGGDDNTFGVTGISPAANTRAISIFGPGMGSAQAIRQAANTLAAGDIILIELHRPGPRHNFESRNDQLGYIAVEWWPDDFDAILFATTRGVIVVEAGGNGAENLDDALYNNRPAEFPASWTNPFNRGNRDSGAIVVGAGAPPPGTHGRDHGPDRSRLDFSNYGALVDAQGWGREVTTCAYGDLQGGASEDVFYTDVFSGTSSASPIVVGALAALQGAARANGQQLTPSECRGHLRGSGSPQQASSSAPVGQRIGNRPDLRALIARISPVKKEKFEKFEVKEKLEKIEAKEKREKVEGKEKREKFEVKEKRELKEKPEKLEFERVRQGVKLEFEGERGHQLGGRERLRAPGFGAQLDDKQFWSKEKLEKGEKEAKGEVKDKDEKREKTEREEKDPKQEKDVPDKGSKDEKYEKDKDEKGEQAEAGKQEKDTKDFKDGKDEKGDKDKENKDEAGEQANKEAKDTKDTKDGKNEKLENKDKEKEDFQDIGIIRRPGTLPDQGGLDQRLARLEHLVSHFIDPKLRPDLSEGALTYEPDSPKLGAEAAAAKRSKEDADTKLSEV
jgi:hypothetical protein